MAVNGHFLGHMIATVDDGGFCAADEIYCRGLQSKIWSKEADNSCPATRRDEIRWGTHDRAAGARRRRITKIGHRRSLSPRGYVSQ